MAKKLIIETEVKTDGIDKAVSKLGELKQLSSKVSVQYDIDGKPLDIVIDKTLNLGQQVKVLTAELRRTKEGTAEFALLNTKLKESQDSLARVNQKNRDLFATFSLIPGPIGDIFGKLNGVIGLLKTFSGFSLKDFGNQFKDLKNDIVGIIDGFYGVSKATEESTEKIEKQSTVIASNNTNTQQNTVDVEDNTEAQEDNTSAVDQGNAATNASNAALIKNQEVRKASTKTILSEAEAVQLLKRRGIEVSEFYVEGADGAGKFVTRIKDSTGAIADLDKEQLQLIRTFNDEEQAILENNRTLEGLGSALKTAETRTKGLTLQQTVLAKGLQLVTFSARAAELALKSIGIGFIIAAVAALVDLLTTFATEWYDVATGAKAAKDALDEANKSIERTNELLTLDLADAKRRNAEFIALIKSRGATEKEVQEQTVKGLKEQLALTETALNDAITAENKYLASKSDNAGEVKKLSDNTTKLEQQAKDLRSQIRVAELGEIEKTTKKLSEESKKRAEIIKNDTLKANELLFKLQQENSVNILKEERKREDLQLKIDKENEERDIKKLQINEELKGKLLEQIRVKYGIKIIELNKKRQDEDNKAFDESQKKVKEYQDKIFQIFNDADNNELSRNKAARAKKLEDDKLAIQNDVNFQKQSLEDKIRILLALEKAFDNDIQKLDDDEAAKNKKKASTRLADELRFLQIKGEALRQGTKSFFDNQRAILKAAEQQEIADLEAKGAEEKMTVEQIEKEKLAIKEKYLKAAKDISDQELQAILAAAQATLGVAQSIATDIGKVAQLNQQVALEEANKRYIEQNELDKKTITNKEQLEKKLLDNQKKFAKEEDGIKKRAFEENKKIQIAQAIIATLQSAVGAFSSLAPIPVVGPALAAVAAAAALTFGYLQVAAIKKTQYQSPVDLANSQTVPETMANANPGRNYEKGGMIGGRRHAEGGTLIEAEKGEAIMTRGAVATFGPLLSLMNQAGGGVSFNSNLMTTRQDNPIVNNPTQEQNPLIVKTYVVSQELTTEAERQARLKNLSTI